eukprot:1159806-Pelagomonas_calceolata.AAC.9
MHPLLLWLESGTQGMRWGRGAPAWVCGWGCASCAQLRRGGAWGQARPPLPPPGALQYLPAHGGAG